MFIIEMPFSSIYIDEKLQIYLSTLYSLQYFLDVLDCAIMQLLAHSKCFVWAPTSKYRTVAWRFALRDTRKIRRSRVYFYSARLSTQMFSSIERTLEVVEPNGGRRAVNIICQSVQWSGVFKSSPAARYILYLRQSCLYANLRPADQSMFPSMLYLRLGFD